MDAKRTRGGLDVLASALLCTVLTVGPVLEGTAAEPPAASPAAAEDSSLVPRRVGAIVLEKPEHSLYCGVIDEKSGYAYFSTTSRGPAWVVKVALGEGDAPPKRVAALQLPAGYTHAIAAVADGTHGYAYFGCNGPASQGYVIKAKLGDDDADPTLVGQPVSLGAGEQLPMSAVIDSPRGYAYFACRGNVVKLSLGKGDMPPTVVGSCTALEGQRTGLRRGVIDPEKGYAYFCSMLWGSEGRIVKVKLGAGDASPSLVGTLSLPEGKGLVGSAAIDTVHGYAYFGSYGSHTSEGIDTVTPGRIVKVKLGEGDAPPTFVSLLDVPERHFTVILADPGKGYLYLSNDLVYPSSDVVCVAFGQGDAPMRRMGSLKLRVGPKPWADPKHVPTGTGNDPDLGEVHVQSGVIDLLRGYAYFGTDTWPGQVIKVKLPGH